MPTAGPPGVSEAATTTAAAPTDGPPGVSDAVTPPLSINASKSTRADIGAHLSKHCSLVKFDETAFHQSTGKPPLGEARRSNFGYWFHNRRRLVALKETGTLRSRDGLMQALSRQETARESVRPGVVGVMSEQAFDDPGAHLSRLGRVQPKPRDCEMNQKIEKWQRDRSRARPNAPPRTRRQRARRGG